MGWACSTHCRAGEVHTKFLSENLKERDHSEDLGIEGNTVLEWILRM
jgi:hypothetical protein